MSDHRATEIRTVFHINTWLEQEGYLTTDMGIIGTLGALGITTDRLLKLTSNSVSRAQRVESPRSGC
jgi:predicted AlkP superfamily phosphohydrolase/phosphomutase